MRVARVRDSSAASAAAPLARLGSWPRRAAASRRLAKSKARRSRSGASRIAFTGETASGGDRGAGLRPPARPGRPGSLPAGWRRPPRNRRRSPVAAGPTSGRRHFGADVHVGDADDQFAARRRRRRDSRRSACPARRRCRRCRCPPRRRRRSIASPSGSAPTRVTRRAAVPRRASTAATLKPTPPGEPAGVAGIGGAHHRRPRAPRDAVDGGAAEDRYPVEMAKRLIHGPDPQTPIIPADHIAAGAPGARVLVPPRLAARGLRMVRGDSKAPRRAPPAGETRGRAISMTNPKRPRGLPGARAGAARPASARRAAARLPAEAGGGGPRRAAAAGGDPRQPQLPLGRRRCRFPRPRRGARRPPAARLPEGGEAARGEGISTTRSSSSARRASPSRDGANSARRASLRPRSRRAPDDAALARRLAVARRILAKSRYYEVARAFGRLVASSRPALPRPPAGGHHRRRPGHHGGGQPRRLRRRRPDHRPQHHAAARAVPQPLRHARSSASASTISLCASCTSCFVPRRWSPFPAASAPSTSCSSCLP